MESASIRIGRTDDPTVVNLALWDDHGREMELNLSNLQPGKVDDADILRFLSQLAEKSDGSIAAAIEEASDAATA